MGSDLEIKKKSIPLLTQNEYHDICKKFALDIFNKADKEDRSGRATKDTAKAFHAAASFLKILDQFDTTNKEIKVHEPDGCDDDFENNTIVTNTVFKEDNINQKWKYAR